MRRISFIPRNVAVATIKQRFSAATMVGSESHRQSLCKSYEIESPSRSSYTNKHRRRDLLQVTGLSTSITMLERQTSSPVTIRGTSRTLARSFRLVLRQTEPKSLPTVIATKLKMKHHTWRISQQKKLSCAVKEDFMSANVF